MLECLSQAEWDRIHDDYKAIEPDGQRFILRPTENGETEIIPVLVEKPVPASRTSHKSRISPPSAEA